MDFALTDEQRLISESAREFADREILPRVRDNDRNARFDRDLASKLGEVGYLGAPVAEEYGGRGLDYIGYGLIVEQVGRADSSARTVVSVQTSLVCGSIEQWGSEEQKQRWLPRLCSGEALGCFGLDRGRNRIAAKALLQRRTPNAYKCKRSSNNSPQPFARRLSASRPFASAGAAARISMACS